MKAAHKLAFALLAGAVAGGAAIQALHAQVKPPVYLIEEIDVSDMEAYVREYAVKSRSLGKASGARILVVGNAVATSIEGEPPKSRIVLLQWESLQKLQAWHNSPEYKELRTIGDKYAKFRMFAVEGLPQ